VFSVFFFSSFSSGHSHPQLRRPYKSTHRPHRRKDKGQCVTTIQPVFSGLRLPSLLLLNRLNSLPNLLLHHSSGTLRRLRHLTRDARESARRSEPASSAVGRGEGFDFDRFGGDDALEDELGDAVALLDYGCVG
jgi:hypothetical protein